MAMPVAVDRYWTADDVRALPDDGNRYECIDGELLVTPSPRGLHQIACRDLYELVRVFVVSHGLGELLWSPADIELEQDALVQPDLFVARLKESTRRFREWPEIAGLRLAIEVLSPSTARYDRVVKRAFYLRAGVEEYWIVDLDARLVERWRPGDRSPEILTERLIWQPTNSSERLEIDLPAYFAKLLDD